MADRNGGSFAAGFLVGAIAGAIIGLLFAPRPGEETRQILKEKVADIKEKAAEFAKKTRRSADS